MLSFYYCDLGTFVQTFVIPADTEQRIESSVCTLVDVVGSSGGGRSELLRNK